MDVAHELHRQQLIKAYNNAVKRKDWQAAKNYRDELNILIARRVALSWIKIKCKRIDESQPGLQFVNSFGEKLFAN